jgi:hypothetical protein
MKSYGDFPPPDKASLWMDILPAGTLRLNLGTPCRHLDELLKQGGFWLEIHDSSATLVGWIRFRFIDYVKEQTIFVAQELRPATNPPPARSVVWSGFSEHPQEENER